MMNMMNRFVEGRGHVREIDMLLELTYGDLPLWCGHVAYRIHSILANKLKGGQYVH